MSPRKTKGIIRNPCPMTLKNVSNSDGSFFCGSCSNDIIDFREKSLAEIKQIIGSEKRCGIFNETQVNEPKVSTRYKIHFTVLTLIAFLGFNVKPIKAQTEPLAKDTISTQVCPKMDTRTERIEHRREQKSSKSKIKKRIFFRKRKKVLMGCPDF